MSTKYKIKSGMITIGRDSEGITFKESTTPQLFTEQGCMDLGRDFRLCWDINISGNSGTLSLKYKETTWAKWEIREEENAIHIDLTGFGYDIVLDLSVDWEKKCIFIKGTVKGPFVEKEIDTRICY